MHYGDNIRRPVRIYLVMNEKVGRSVLQGDKAKTREQAGIYPSVFLYLTSKGLFSIFLFHFELTSHSDLTCTWTFGGPCVGLFRGMVTGFDRWRHNIFRQEEARLYFWNFILWFRTVVSCLGEWHAHFSIKNLNQRKTTRPKAQ
jgi:hypothetical protein